MYVIWRVSGRPSGAGLGNVHFEGFCLGNVHILLDIICQNLGISVIWRVREMMKFQMYFVLKVACPQSRLSSKSSVLKVVCPQSRCPQSRVLNVAVLNVACPQCPIGLFTSVQKSTINKNASLDQHVKKCVYDPKCVRL